MNSRRALRIAPLLLLVAATQLPAQLISPGKLSRAHETLEGVRQCTRCHELGQRGISNQRCLDCHDILKSRIAQARGYHATVRGDSCAECHKDHLGRATSPLRFDTASFRHDATGYPLKGAHAEQSCRECHAPAHITSADVRGYQGSAGFLHSTYLGLAAACTSCHKADSPHGSQFGTRACQACHDERDWERTTGFSHDATRYKLTGAHVKVECAKCHPSTPAGMVRYEGLPFARCNDCHRDPHRGSVTGTCSGCHSTNDWQRVDSHAVETKFDHGRTSFPLRGAHERAACASCHRALKDPAIRVLFVRGTESRTYAQPIVRNCASCHVDPHPQSFARAAGKQTCDSCHDLKQWTPADYDVVRHNQIANFKLAGAHVVAACNACHKTRTAPAKACVACHAKEDPHRGVFGKQDCADCHNTDRFAGVKLDHKRVTHLECSSCHARQDVHREQFAGASCGKCHATNSFRIPRFDHNRAAFQLDGAHIRVACASCHPSAVGNDGRAFIRYRPLQTGCKDCHGGKQ